MDDWLGSAQMDLSQWLGNEELQGLIKCVCAVDKLHNPAIFETTELQAALMSDIITTPKYITTSPVEAQFHLHSQQSKVT